jgi:hypothetical protein
MNTTAALIAILAAVMIVPVVLLARKWFNNRDRFIHIYQEQTEDPDQIAFRMRKSRRDRRRGREPIAKTGGHIYKRSRR